MIDLQFVFFYDKYLPDIIHLLEHLMLNPSRFWAKDEVEDQNFIVEWEVINWFTWGVFIAVSLKCHIDDCLKHRITFKKIISDVLQPTLDQIEHEMKIIEHEHDYLSRDLFSDWFTYNFWTKDSKYNQDVITIDLIKNAYNDVILNNSSLVLLNWDLQSEIVFELKEHISSFLQKKNTSYPNRSPKEFTYNPRIDKASSFSKKEYVTWILYYGTSKRLNQHTWLLHLFVGIVVRKYLLYYLRTVNWSTYEVSMEYRNTPYCWEHYYEFIVDNESQDLHSLLANLPMVIGESFEKYKKTIIKDIIISMMNDRNLLPYYTIQFFYLENKYYSLDEIENSFLSITKQEFENLYSSWLKNISFVVYDENINL